MAQFMFDIHKALRPNILRLKPYRCARDDYSTGILLDANENAYGASLSGLKTNLADEIVQKLHRYPDPYQLEVKKLLVENYCKGVDVKQVFVGTGSDEAIDLLFRAFCRPQIDKVLICPPTYGMYSVSADIHDVEVVKVPLTQDFQLQTDLILETVRKGNVKILFICSPGNPTGTLVNRADVLKILEARFEQTVVVLDEAYIDFCDESETTSFISEVNKYDNLVVLRTLSKSFGLAGLRFGFAASSERIIHFLNCVKAPYNVSLVVENVAKNALSAASVREMKRKVCLLNKERARMIKELNSLPGVTLRGKPDANFLLVEFISEKVPKNDYAFWLYKELAEKHTIVVRYRGDNLHCDGCLRLTIGTTEENDYLIRILKELISQ